MLGVEEIYSIAIEEDFLRFVKGHAVCLEIFFGLFFIPTELHSCNIYEYICWTNAEQSLNVSQGNFRQMVLAPSRNALEYQEMKTRSPG